jgi:AbrB family looped-hinge helix DNA binding protein
MDRVITIDGAGRVVLPKDLRERLHLHQGSRLRVVDEGNRVTLEPLGDATPIVEKDGVPVVQSICVGDWPDPRDLRDERLDRLGRMGQ